MINHRDFMLSSQSRENNSEGDSIRCNANEQTVISTINDCSPSCIELEAKRSVKFPSAISLNDIDEHSSVVRDLYASTVYGSAASTLGFGISGARGGAEGPTALRLDGMTDDVAGKDSVGCETVCSAWAARASFHHSIKAIVASPLPIMKRIQQNFFPWGRAKADRKPSQRT